MRSRRWQRWVGSGLLLGGVAATAPHAVAQDAPPADDLAFWSTDEVRAAAAKINPASTSNAAALPAAEAARLAEPAAPDLKVDADLEGGASTEVSAIGDAHFGIKIKDGGWLSDWYLVHVTNVPVGGKTVRFDIQSNTSLLTANPVYTYATDLADPAAYAPLEHAEVTLDHAANGALMPVAETSPWKFIPSVWRSEINAVSFVQRFEKDAIVALRVPYGLGIHEAFLKTLADNAAVKVNRLGGGDGPAVIEIGSTDSAKRAANPSVVIYTGEQGAQPDGSWAIEGAVRLLMGDSPEGIAVREKCTFLLIPVIDPAANTACKFTVGAVTFNGGLSPLAISYTDFFSQWVSDGHKIAGAVDLYTGDATERVHVREFGVSGKGDATKAFREKFGAALKETKLFTFLGSQDDGTDYPYRLIGWLQKNFDAVPLMFNINSQERTRHLSLDETRHFGGVLVTTLADYFSDAANAEKGAKP